MKATITITVHSLESLDAVQLANLTRDTVKRFGVTPSVEDNTMVIRFTTDDHKKIFQIVEALQPELARKFSHDLWLSVASEEPKGC